MTDELMIQPQIQERRANPAAYALGGAVLGAGAGYGINAAVKHYTKEPVTSWEEINRLAKDTTDFSSKFKGEEATFNSIRAKATEIKGLENELSKLPEKTLPDTENEAKVLKEAKEKRDAEFNRLLEIEKSKGGTRVYTAGKFPTEKTLKDSLTTSEFDIIKPYMDQYKQARNRLFGAQGLTNPGGKAKPAYDAITTSQNNARRFYVDIWQNNYKKLGEAKRADFDPNCRKVRKKIEANIDEVLPQSGKKLANLINSKEKFNEYQAMFGDEIFTLVDEKPSYGRHSNLKPFGFMVDGKKQWVEINEEALDAKYDALKTEFGENVNKMNDLLTEKEKFNEKFFKENKAALSRLPRPITSANDLNHIGSISDFSKKLDQLTFMEEGCGLNGHKKVVNFPFLFCKMDGTVVYVRNKGELNKLTSYKDKIADALEVVTSYEKESGQIDNQIREILNQDPRVKRSKAKFKTFVEKDTGMKNVLEYMERRLNGTRANDKQRAVWEKVQGLMGESEISTDFEANVREKMKNGSFENAVADAQKKYDKAIETKGVANAEARKALQDKLSTANAEFEKGCKELASKFTKGAKGINPWLATGIGAVVLGLVGSGIASSKNS